MSLNKPERNLTGVTFFGGAVLDAKRLELMRDLVPAATVVGVLGDPSYPSFEAVLPQVMGPGAPLAGRSRSRGLPGTKNWLPLSRRCGRPASTHL